MQPSQRWLDLTKVLGPKTLAWGSDSGIGDSFRRVKTSPAKGDAFTSSIIELATHQGTHVRAL